MFASVYNWFLNTFVRVNPYVKATICIVLLLVTLIFIKSGLKNSNAKGGDKRKDWKIGYFIFAGLFMILAGLIMFL